ATLIEVGKYSESDAELFIDNIQQKVISNGIKYTRAESSNIEESLNIEEPANVEEPSNVGIDKFLDMSAIDPAAYW
ncbi:1530_t:CDS:2, partial [Scutellospora calospora]